MCIRDRISSSRLILDRPATSCSVARWYSSALLSSRSSLRFGGLRREGAAAFFRGPAARSAAFAFPADRSPAAPFAFPAADRSPAAPFAFRADRSAAAPFASAPGRSPPSPFVLPADRPPPVPLDSAAGFPPRAPPARSRLPRSTSMRSTTLVACGASSATATSCPSALARTSSRTFSWYVSW